MEHYGRQFWSSIAQNHCWRRCSNGFALGVSRGIHLRKYEVENYRQGPSQSTQHYGALFQAKVLKAYRTDDLNNRLIVTQLIRLFGNGIHDSRVRYATAQANPRTLDAAYEHALQGERATMWVRDERTVEPMDISALPRASDRR